MPPDLIVQHLVNSFSERGSTTQRSIEPAQGWSRLPLGGGLMSLFYSEDCQLSRSDGSRRLVDPGGITDPTVWRMMREWICQIING